MKKRFLVLICLLGMALPHLWAQASTEGREFWVALTIGRAPDDKNDSFGPYLCISSKTRKGTVTVTNPITKWTRSYPMEADGWLTIKDIPLEQWYPYPNGDNGQWKASGQKFKTGLKVTCNEEVSVYAALRYGFAFDATNILPITALQYEYVTQDYPPYANGTSTSYSNFCILATENNTQVQITPANVTYDGKPAGVPFTVTLQAGEVYYVFSKEGGETNAATVCLTGSEVISLNGKKIAVFNGDVCTRIPNGTAARDIAYEQAMPIDYWGTQFVVTRSLEKDANRIRITALEDDTQIKLDGYNFTTLDSRETIEIELAVAADVKGHDLPLGYQFIQDVMYIEATCPIAVYNYDTGNSCASKTASEIFSGYGDPSMTWVSPLEQKIKEITFGAMNTNKTTRHFVNIVTPTSEVASVELKEVAANGTLSPNNLAIGMFQPVPKNAEYSYARIPLTIDSDAAYKLSGEGGFIAHVYGNGDDESYAYSAGSSAVSRGIKIGEDNFEDGVNITEEQKIMYCINDSLHFNPQWSDRYVIESTHWDMGDGITFDFGKDTIDFWYQYESPGWYDLTVSVTLGFNECTGAKGEKYDVNLSFYVNRPDTIVVEKSLCEGETFTWVENNNQQYPRATDYDAQGNVLPLIVDTTQGVCDTVRILHLHIGKNTIGEDVYVTGNDSVLWDGKWYYTHDDFETTIPNSLGCDSTFHVYIKVLACLKMEVGKPDEIICGDDGENEDEYFTISYNLIKGTFDEELVRLECDGKSYKPDLNRSTETEFYFNLKDIAPGNYSNAQLVVTDTLSGCQETHRFDVPFEVKYPANVFVQKWQDVWAVYNENYNAGHWKFVKFQWYRNGEPIPGATGSWYDNQVPFTDGDEYTVELTRADGVTLFACPQVAKVAAPEPAAVSVAPNVVNGGERIRIVTLTEGEAILYNTLGLQEMRMPAGTDTQLTMPTRAGVYVLQVILNDGTITSQQIIVK